MEKAYYYIVDWDSEAWCFVLLGEEDDIVNALEAKFPNVCLHKVVSFDKDLQCKLRHRRKIAEGVTLLSCWFIKDLATCMKSKEAPLKVHKDRRAV